MDSRFEEVKKDFLDSLEKINFSAYNPNSSEFMDALRIGIMWHLLCEVDDCCEKTESETLKADDEIADKIMSAKKHLQKFIDTEDISFKEISEDELRHAEILVKKAYSKLPSGEEKSKLKEYEMKIKEVFAQVEKA